MIFIGCNHRVGFPRYYGHHTPLNDIRFFSREERIKWNELKDKESIYGIVEWVIGYAKPYCRKCMALFIDKGSSFLQFNEYHKPTRRDRIQIVEQLKQRERFLDNKYDRVTQFIVQEFFNYFNEKQIKTLLNLVLNRWTI